MAVAKLLILARQGGKTHLLAHWCKKNGGAILCFSKEEANRIKKVYGVDAFSVNSNLAHSIQSRPIAVDNLWNMLNAREAMSLAYVIAQEKPILASMDPIFEITSKEKLEQEIWPERYEKKE